MIPIIGQKSHAAPPKVQPRVGTNGADVVVLQIDFDGGLQVYACPMSLEFCEQQFVPALVAAINQARAIRSAAQSAVQSNGHGMHVVRG